MTPAFFFVSERTFEPWDWTNPDTVGIGGSETSHIEMAQRLSRRGADVKSYAPVAFDGWRTDPAGVDWRACEFFNPDNVPGPTKRRKDSVNDRAVYVIYRAPQVVDMLPAGAVAWLICQDVDYWRDLPDRDLTEERALKFTRIVALCEAQAGYLRRRLPAAADRIVVSSNGIKAEQIAEIAADPPERNLLRLTYASSPDRGLEYLLPIFTRIREIVPDAELHVCYGFDNMDKVIERSIRGDLVAEAKRKLLDAMDQPGVVHYGRMNQRHLLREWYKTAVWCHPSNFTETSCITCMDAQACGAVPVTSPVWAIAENVQHGVFIEGDIRGEMVRSRYINAVAELLLNPQIQAEYRAGMQQWAVLQFDWEVFVTQWLKWAAYDLALTGRVDFTKVGLTAVPA